MRTHAKTSAAALPDIIFNIDAVQKIFWSEKLISRRPLGRKDLCVCEKINNTLCTRQTMLPATQYGLCSRVAAAEGSRVHGCGPRGGTCGPRTRAPLRRPPLKWTHGSFLPAAARVSHIFKRPRATLQLRVCIWSKYVRIVHICLIITCLHAKLANKFIEASLEYIWLSIFNLYKHCFMLSVSVQLVSNTCQQNKILIDAF